MNLLSFNFTKISAEKELNFKYSDIKTNIEFIDIEKDEIEMLKDSDALKVSFKFVIEYLKSKEEKSKENTGKLVFEGLVLFSSKKEESKEILSAWKNKDLSPAIRIALFNLILKKCSIKALSLEEELGLPYHIPLPRAQNTSKKE